MSKLLLAASSSVLLTAVSSASTKHGKTHHKHKKHDKKVVRRLRGAHPHKPEVIATEANAEEEVEGSSFAQTNEVGQGQGATANAAQPVQAPPQEPPQQQQPPPPNAPPLTAAAQQPVPQQPAAAVPGPAEPAAQAPQAAPINVAQPPQAGPPMNAAPPPQQPQGPPQASLRQTGSYPQQGYGQPPPPPYGYPNYPPQGYPPQQMGYGQPPPYGYPQQGYPPQGAYPGYPPQQAMYQQQQQYPQQQMNYGAPQNPNAAAPAQKAATLKKRAPRPIDRIWDPQSVAMEWIDEAKKAKLATQNETDAVKAQASSASAMSPVEIAAKTGKIDPLLSLVEKEIMSTAQDEYEKDMERAKDKYFPGVEDHGGADARFGRR